MAEAVKVIVRCRPMNEREKGLKCGTVVDIDGQMARCSITNPDDRNAPPKTFTFDGAYDTASSTEQIYADIGFPLVEGVTEGYNGTIFAYGQTGCGKSFTMQGITDPATQRGIIPRAFDHIFETIQVSVGVKYLVHASYLEIYNEEIRDLLGKDVKHKLDLKEHPDKGVYVQDYVKVSNIATDQMLYTEKDIEASMDRIETVNFHQETEVGGVKFWCYNAGHVLGAAMFMIEIAGVKILYTGDFSRQEDRHLMAAELPNVHPDVLIIEATYGTHIHEPREERETRFTTLVQDIVSRGGRCLIPVFALGRAQELMLILDEYWANHPDLHEVPIYYASSLAKRCMTVYQTYINAMNERIRRQISDRNPFVFKHISNLKSIDHFEDIGPSVVMASPGMMQSGLSRELFETWCTDRRNGVIVAGYCVEGTLAKHILSEPTEIVSMNGQKLPLRCSVDYISFSAHTDYRQTSEFVRALKPPHIVLVHGEQNEMARLRAALVREYEDAPVEGRIEVHSPRNSQSVELTFRGEKMAKVVGRLAVDRPTTANQQDRKISGVLVKRNFNYHIMAPSDLPTYTDLAMSTVTQRQSVPYTGTLNQLQYYLNQLSADVEKSTTGGSSSLNVLKVFGGAVSITLEPRYVVIEWVANPVNDMYADAVLAIVLKADTEAPKTVAPVKVDKSHFNECLMELLGEMFGSSCVDRLIRGERLKLVVDRKDIWIDLRSLDVQCADDEVLQQMVSTAVTKLHRAITPIKL